MVSPPLALSLVLAAVAPSAILLVVASALVGAAVGIAVAWLVRVLRTEDLQQGAEWRYDVSRINELRRLDLSYRVLQPAIQALAKVNRLVFRESLPEIQRQVFAAGLPRFWLAEEYLARAELIALMLTPLYVWFFVTKFGNVGVLLALLAALLTVGLIRFRLAQRAATRLKAIKRRMPFLLDLLTLLMEAGSTFLRALAQAVEEFQGHPVAEEFGRVLTDMNLGKTRTEAFIAMRQRLADDEITSIIGSILQGENLGTPLAQVFRTQADVLRLKRTQRRDGCRRGRRENASPGGAGHGVHRAGDHRALSPQLPRLQPRNLPLIRLPWNRCRLPYVRGSQFPRDLVRTLRKRRRQTLPASDTKRLSFQAMPIQLDCPQCKRPLAIPSKKAGSFVACPQCNARLWVPGDASKAKPIAPVEGAPLSPSRLAPPPASPPASQAARSLVPTPPPEPVSAAPAHSLVPAKPAKVAHFITAQTARSTLKPADDGRLPELHLSEPGRAAPQEATSRGTNPLVLFGLLCLSAVASLVLLLWPTEPGQGARQPEKEQVRQAIRDRFFADMDQMPRQPYQLMLREAQRAHARGDFRQERALYRKVLGLLRAERKPERGVTGSLGLDQELEQYLTLLLSDG